MGKERKLKVGGPGDAGRRDDMTARCMKQVPTVSLDFVIEEIGYQMDVYVNGKCFEIECRDFGGAPGPKKAIESLILRIHDAVDNWRNLL